MASLPRLFSTGLGTAINFAFNPVVSGSILLFHTYAPTEVQSQVYDLLAPYVSAAAIGRLVAFCTFSFWSTLALRINWYLSARFQNNWVDDKYDWQKEIVLITGASSGIGERVAELLAQKGITIIALDVKPLNKHVAQYDNVHFYECDITDPSKLASVAARIRSDHGDPTVLFNNAGMVGDGGILESSMSRIQKVIDLNIVCHFSTVQQFVPAMIKNNHGHIISMASLASYMTIIRGVDYCVSKAGVAAFHEGLRQELRHIHKAKKVRTSIVHPSWVRTPLIPEDTQKTLRQNGHAVLKVDQVAVPITELILSGYGDQLMLPREVSIAALPGLRGWPHWFQEGLRDLVKPWS